MKNLEDMTLKEVVHWQQGLILLAIPTGQFNQAVFDACNMVLRWKAAQDEKASAA